MIARRFALLLLLPLAGCHRPESPRAVLTPVVVTQARAAKAGEVGALRYTGSIAPETQVDLAFKNGGYVADILRVRDSNGQPRLVQEGDRVRAGTILATLRQGDYTTRIAQARAQQAQAQAGVAQAQAGLTQAQAGVEQATAGQREAEAGEQAARAQLAEAEAGRRQAAQQVEAARIAREAAAKQAAEAQAAVEQAEAGVAEAEAGLTKAQQDYARADALYRADSLTRTDYDAATANVAAAQARRQQAAKQVQGAQARAEAAQAQVRAAQNRIEQAQTQATAAETKVAQAQAQVAARASQVAQAAARGNASVAGIKTAQAQVRAAQAAARGAGAQLAAAQIPQGESELRAPIDGVLLSRRVEVGALVGPGATVFSVADVSRVKVAFGVPDLQVTALKLGRQVRITVDALRQRSFTGNITTISPAADPRTRVFNVEVTVQNPLRELRVGMIVTLSLPERVETMGRALIPLAALVHPDNHPDGYAAVILGKEGGQAVVHWRDVQLGAVQGNLIAVGGVQPGEQIVTTGAAMVHDGETVQVMGGGVEAGNGAQE